MYFKGAILGSENALLGDCQLVMKFGTKSFVYLLAPSDNESALEQLEDDPRSSLCTWTAASLIPEMIERIP